MPIPLIIAGAAIGAGAIGSAAISSSAQSKAAKNAAELAREQQNTALAEQKRLEEKYGLTPGELAREQRLFGIPQGDEAIKFAEGSLGLEPKQQTELERRAGKTGEELLREVGPETRQLLETVAQRQGMTGEELFKAEGAIPTALQEQILKDVQAPGASYQDTLNQQLELARTMVNAEANRRGVFGGLPEGGIRFENLGRAGVDLAIKSATEKQAAKQQDLANASTLATLFQNLSSASRSEAGTVAQSAIGAQDKARTELNAFLENMQNQSATSKGRVASVATGASQVAAGQTGQAYSNLIGLEGYKSQITSPAEAGLSALGQIGADYLGQNLPSAKTTTPAPSTYDELLKTNKDYDSLTTLSDITGSGSLKKKKLNFLSEY